MVVFSWCPVHTPPSPVSMETGSDTGSDTVSVMLEVVVLMCVEAVTEGDEVWAEQGLVEEVGPETKRAES